MYQGFGYELSRVMPTAIQTGLYSSLCTLQEPDGVIVGAGQPSGNYVDVAGLVNIQCMDAPMSEGRILADEVKSFAEIISERLRHISLDGCYTGIPAGQEAGWRAQITDTTTGLVVTYDLLGSEIDSQGTQTRLHLRTATI
jgi:hypothetical protein